MAGRLQLRRGTTSQNDAFTGAIGEMTMDTQKKGLRVHDGTTQGGIEIPTANTADYVVEFQAPTAQNDYTWYRKYKSGWVEQGGEWVHPSPGTAYNNVTITLPVVMSGSNYSVILSNTGTNGTAYTKTVNTRTTTDFICTGAGDVSKYNGFCWAARGMAA